MVPPAPVASVPCELLQRVFALVPASERPRLSLVCKRWRGVLGGPSCAWRDMSFRGPAADADLAGGWVRARAGRDTAEVSVLREMSASATCAVLSGLAGLSGGLHRVCIETASVLTAEQVVPALSAWSSSLTHLSFRHGGSLGVLSGLPAMSAMRELHFSRFGPGDGEQLPPAAVFGGVTRFCASARVGLQHAYVQPQQASLPAAWLGGLTSLRRLTTSCAMAPSFCVSALTRLTCLKWCARDWSPPPLLDGSRLPPSLVELHVPAHVCFERVGAMPRSLLRAVYVYYSASSERMCASWLEGWLSLNEELVVFVHEGVSFDEDEEDESVYSLSVHRPWEDPPFQVTAPATYYLGTAPPEARARLYGLLQLCHGRVRVHERRSMGW